MKPKSTVIHGKFGKIKLSPSLVDKFQCEARRLESILQENGYSGIQGWLDSDEFIGSRENAPQDDLANWGFFNLSSTEGYAWFLQKYFQ